MPDSQPDLRTKEGAMQFLDYHAPNEHQVNDHIHVNDCFQILLEAVWDSIPDGPGKTIAIRSMNRARMDCNSAIANQGG